MQSPCGDPLYCSFSSVLQLACHKSPSSSSVMTSDLPSFSLCSSLSSSSFSHSRSSIDWEHWPGRGDPVWGWRSSGGLRSTSFDCFRVFRGMGSSVQNLRFMKENKPQFCCTYGFIHVHNHLLQTESNGQENLWTCVNCKINNYIIFFNNVFNCMLF